MNKGGCQFTHILLSGAVDWPGMMADIEIYTERMLVVSGDRGLFISVLGIKVFLVPLHLHLRGSVQIQKTLQPFIMNHNIHCQTEPQTLPSSGTIFQLDCFLYWQSEVRLEVVEVSVVIIFADQDSPAPQFHSGKQINILFVYAENNNYFMVGVVLCSTVYSLW